MTSQVEQDRRRTLEELRARGVEPFAYRYEVDTYAEQARGEFEDAEAAGTVGEDGLGAAVRLAGRITSLRTHGKATFADLADRSGRIQLFFRRNVVGDGPYDLLGLLHVGDWIGAAGRTMRTRTGEVSVLVDSFELLAKSLRPLPYGKEETDEATGEKVVHSGFADVQQRYILTYTPTNQTMDGTWRTIRLETIRRRRGFGRTSPTPITARPSVCTPMVSSRRARARSFSIRTVAMRGPAARPVVATKKASSPCATNRI